MNNVLFAPIFAYILWVSLIYMCLTVMRAPSIWGVGAKSNGDNPFALIEPKVSANLSNQFEWPVLFFAIVIILIARPEYIQIQHLWLSWLFVVGRIIHSVVHIFTNNIRLRGTVFNINFLAVLSMWVLLAFKLYE